MDKNLLGAAGRLSHFWMLLHVDVPQAVHEFLFGTPVELLPPPVVGVFHLSWGPNELVIATITKALLT